MQKIFSTRLEEATLNELARVTQKLGISKRQFLEEAIHQRADRESGEKAGDAWSETLGAWRRSESVGSTIRRARREFERGFERRHRTTNARVHR